MQKLPNSLIENGIVSTEEAELLKITSLAPTHLNEIQDENEDSFSDSSSCESLERKTLSAPISNTHESAQQIEE